MFHLAQYFWGRSTERELPDRLSSQVVSSQELHHPCHQLAETLWTGAVVCLDALSPAVLCPSHNLICYVILWLFLRYDHRTSTSCHCDLLSHAPNSLNSSNSQPKTPKIFDTHTQTYLLAKRFLNSNFVYHVHVAGMWDPSGHFDQKLGKHYFWLMLSMFFFLEILCKNNDWFKGTPTVFIDVREKCVHVCFREARLVYRRVPWWVESW